MGKTEATEVFCFLLMKQSSSAASVLKIVAACKDKSKWKQTFFA